ncbi:hypothetical protein D3C80_2140700 [compost metagenome]
MSLVTFCPHLAYIYYLLSLIDHLFASYLLDFFVSLDFDVDHNLSYCQTLSYHRERIVNLCSKI